MTKEEKRTIKILETATTKIGNHYKIGQLRKENNRILNYNKGMVVHRFHLTERKFTNNNELAMKYKELLMNIYQRGTQKNYPKKKLIE